jgi:hypothetical protein
MLYFSRKSHRASPHRAGSFLCIGPMSELTITVERARARAKDLKLKQAAINLAALLIIAPAYLAGKVWWVAKFVAGLAIEGFRRGAGG